LRVRNIANFTHNFGQILILTENYGDIQFVVLGHSHNVQTESEVNPLLSLHRNLML